MGPTARVADFVAGSAGPVGLGCSARSFGFADSHSAESSPAQLYSFPAAAFVLVRFVSPAAAAVEFVMAQSAELADFATAMSASLAKAFAETPVANSAADWPAP